MKKILLLTSLLMLTLALSGYTIADVTLSLHDCSKVGIVKCENGNVSVTHKVILEQRRGAVVSDFTRRHLTMLTYSDADKSITNANIEAKKYLYNGNGGNVCILPYFTNALWNEAPVVKIAPEAFKDCVYLKKFSVDDDTSDWGNRYMPIYIGENAFENCVSLEGIRFPQYSYNSPEYKLRYTFDEYMLKTTYYTTIGAYAFKNCTNLKYVIIDGRDTIIEENAFYGCPNVVIYCLSGSKAEEYAIENGIKYVLMDIEPSELEKAIFDYDMYAQNNPKLLEYSQYDYYFKDKEDRRNKDELIDDYSLMLADWIGRGVGEGIKGSRVFDAEYYFAAYPGLRKTYNNDYAAGYSHFLRFGCNELRKSSLEYDGAAYKNRYQDLASLTGEQLLIHYVNHGISENRNAKSEPVSGKFGDADGDNVITAVDAAIVLQKTLNLSYVVPIENVSEDYVKYIDVDKSGSVDAADAAQIIQKVLVSTYKMPAE